MRLVLLAQLRADETNHTATRSLVEERGERRGMKYFPLRLSLIKLVHDEAKRGGSIREEL
jgi:hypothetical protein